MSRKVIGDVFVPHNGTYCNRTNLVLETGVNYFNAPPGVPGTRYVPWARTLIPAEVWPAMRGGLMLFEWSWSLEMVFVAGCANLVEPSDSL